MLLVTSKTQGDGARPVRMVLVDDNKVFLDALHAWLARYDGVQISACAASGAEGLQLIEREKPDLVLMNMFMHGVSGVEASRRIARDGDLPKVVLMSSLEDPSLPNVARNAGADAFIFKQEMYFQLSRHLEHWFRATGQREVGCLCNS